MDQCPPGTAPSPLWPSLIPIAGAIGAVVYAVVAAWSRQRRPVLRALAGVGAAIVCLAVAVAYAFWAIMHCRPAG